MDFAEINNNDYLLLLQKMAAAGDQAAFRKLFDLFFDRLNRYARTVVHSNDGAVEIVDDVFVKLWRQKHTLVAIQNLRVYLYAATRNTALNYLSRQALQATEPFDPELVAQPTDPGPEHLLIIAELAEKIAEAVEALPPRCRIIFNMVREDGLKYREVAELLNISVNTVDAQMVIAVNRIRERVKTHIESPGRWAAQKNLLSLLGSLALATVLLR